MASITVNLRGVEYTCIAALIGHERERIVGVDVFRGQDLRGRAAIYPPYVSGGTRHLAALPSEQLVESLLNSFIAGELGIDVEWFLGRYDALVKAGFDTQTIDVKLRSTFPIHPGPQA